MLHNLTSLGLRSKGCDLFSQEIDEISAEIGCKWSLEEIQHFFADKLLRALLLNFGCSSLCVVTHETEYD